MDIIFIEEEEEKEDVEKMRELIIHSPFLSPLQGRSQERESLNPPGGWLSEVSRLWILKIQKFLRIACMCREQEYIGQY